MKLRQLAWTAGLFWVFAASATQRGMPEDIGGVPEQKAFSEDELKLPPLPEEGALIEFRPRGSSSNRYYIDRDSVSLGEDRVVRYTALVRSRNGVDNISYEGLRCKDAKYKVYAYGTPKGEWKEARGPQWRDVGVSVGNFRFSLFKDYLCDSEAVAGRNAADLVLNLRDDPLHKSDRTKR
jgi:hypothetical protein